MSRMWRGSADAENPIDIAALAVSPHEAHPSGLAPQNLRIATAGGFENVTYRESDEEVNALRKAMSAAPATTVFLLDTDAELNERAPSRIAIEAAECIVLLSSPNWADFLRCMMDPVNNIRAFAPKTTRLLFTKVPKTRNEASCIENVECMGFKPVKSAAENITTITAYARERGLLPAIGASLLALPDFPETVLSHSVETATPIVCMESVEGVATEALAAAKEHLAFAAKRLYV